MKKNFYLLICFCSVILFSCQKSIDWSDVDLAGRTPPAPTTGGGGSGGGTEGVLLRIVSKDIGKADSSVTSIVWGSDNRISEFKMYGYESGTTPGTGGNADLVYKFSRLSDGRVSGGVLKDKSNIGGTGGFLDSAIYSLVYNSDNSTVKYMIRVMKTSVFDRIDSIIYFYNGDKQVISMMNWSKIDLAGLPTSFELSHKIEYAYTASGNIGSKKMTTYTTPGSSDVLISTYSYDDKQAPLELSHSEAVLLDFFEYRVKNNITKIKTEYFSGVSPTPNLANLEEFTDRVYNSKNKPVSGKSTSTNITTGIVEETSLVSYIYK